MADTIKLLLFRDRLRRIFSHESHLGRLRAFFHHSIGHLEDALRRETVLPRLGTLCVIQILSDTVSIDLFVAANDALFRECAVQLAFCGRFGVARITRLLDAVEVQRFLCRADGELLRVEQFVALPDRPIVIDGFLFGLLRLINERIGRKQPIF